MVASGVPIRNGDQVSSISHSMIIEVSSLKLLETFKHAGEIASFALELLEFVHKFEIRHQPSEILKLRIGIHR